MTLVDADEFTSQDIAELYGFRWNAELDIRSIKASLNLAHVRCKSPKMAQRENRPGRPKPRVLKRRRHGYPLMQKSRRVLRAELRHECT